MATTRTALLFTAVLGLAAQASAQEILREAVGQRATQLAEMELKPFDASLWSRLSGWTNGTALDTAATDGKVVLIATWASWNPAARRAISTIQDIKEDFADQDLVVVGVHHATGWDGAAGALEQRDANFLIAHDTDGKFRAGIKSDQDPDFYVIDRAGQLRFADVRTESVRDAVEQLLAEDAGAAGSLAGRLADEARARREALRRPQEIQDRVDLATLPEVPFATPPETMYALADWPERSTDDDDRGRRDDSGPRQLGVPGSGWVSGAPPKTAGRVVAYYSWVLEDQASSSIAREMDVLQKQLGRDAVIVGVMVGVRVQDGRGGRDDGPTDAGNAALRLQRFRTVHGIQHPMILGDPGGIFDGDRGRDESVYGAVVVSSDSTVRWQGRSRDGFLAALDKVIAEDPGVKARRAAEAAFIRAKQGG